MNKNPKFAKQFIKHYPASTAQFMKFGREYKFWASLRTRKEILTVNHLVHYNENFNPFNNRRKT